MPAKVASSPQPAFATHTGWPTAKPADVATPEATVRSFFSAISAAAGGKLDRTRLDALFVPEGRIAVGLVGRPSRAADVLFLTPDQYADGSDKMTATSGFFDKNPANHVQHFGVMAHVYASYESREHADDAKPMARGIKSFELLHRGDGWYIVEVYWDWERPDNPLPETYLHDSRE